MIKKEGNEYCVYSKTGERKLGCFPTEKAARKRLQQIEHFKKTMESVPEFPQEEALLYKLAEVVDKLEIEEEGGEAEINEPMKILHTAPTILTEDLSGEGGWNDLIMEGSYVDMNGLPVEVTPDTIQKYLQNFNEGVRGQDVPITIDHPERGGVAAGWIRSLRVADRKAKKILQGLIDWTPTGTEKVQGKEYRYISSEILPKDVLKAASLVNFPAVKGMNPVELGEDGREYTHIYLMGGEPDVENQEAFMNTFVETVVDRIKALLLADKETPMKGKVKKHLPDNEKGKQWCIFQDGKQLSCGPDEAWASEQLNPTKKEEKKEKKPIKASEEQGGENTNMDETTKLIEDKIAEAVKPLAEENKSLREKLDTSTTELAGVMAARRQEQLEARVIGALKCGEGKQYTPAVSEALKATVLAEPKEYEDKVFELLEILQNPDSVIDLSEKGTSAEKEKAPGKNTTAHTEKANARALEIQKETGCTYKLAAKQALDELAKLSD